MSTTRAEELTEADREFARQWRLRDKMHELRKSTITIGGTWFWHDMPAFLIRLEENGRGDTVRFDRECDAMDALALQLKRIRESLGYDSAYAAGRAAGLEAGITICDEEEKAYAENRKQCDAAGNTTGGTHDACGELACRQVAGRLRLLAKGEA